MHSPLVTWCLILTALAGCGGGGGAASTTQESPATLAYVVTQCAESGEIGFFGPTRLEVRRGDAPPLTIKEIPRLGPLPSTGLCQVYGANRVGGTSVAG